MPYRGQPPVLLALIGDSGTGKSTLSHGMLETLGAERVAELCLDDYHRYDRVERQKLGITALHPDCNHLLLMKQHLQLLRRGETIFKPVYDHTEGTFGPPEHLKPTQFLVVHGLLGLHDEALKSIYHVSIFLDPDPELRVQWKIQRDTSKRGYTVDEVKKQLQQRQPDAEQFIMPQRERADIVVSFYPQPGYWATRDNSQLNVRILLRKSLPAYMFADLLAQAEQNARRDGVVRPFLSVEKSGDLITIEIDGSMPPELANQLEERFWSEMHRVRHLRPEAIGLFQQDGETRRSNSLAVTQLLVTFYCIQAAEFERGQLASAASAASANAASANAAKETAAKETATKETAANPAPASAAL
jgi:phosphoribulokinase